MVKRWTCGELKAILEMVPDGAQIVLSDWEGNNCGKTGDGLHELTIHPYQDAVVIGYDPNGS